MQSRFRLAAVEVAEVVAEEKAAVEVVEAEEKAAEVATVVEEGLAGKGRVAEFHFATLFGERRRSDANLIRQKMECRVGVGLFISWSGMSPPQQIGDSQQQQTDADHCVDVEEGDTDSAQIVGANERMLIRQQQRDGDDADQEERSESGHAPKDEQTNGGQQVTQGG